MPVFIELTTDAFAATFTRAHDAAAKARRAGVDRARRPLRGLEIKDDTYAFMKIVRADGTEIKLVDSSSDTGESTQYSNFILQSVQEARMEKHQIVETFGAPYIYFFGEAPRFLDVQAVLVDSLDFNWYAEFWENYNKFFRGTRSVELGARTYLFYDDNVVEGYVLMAQASKNADQPLQARLSFRMFLTNYSNVTFVGDPNFPVRASVNLPPSVNLSNADAFTVGAAAASAASNAALQESVNLQAATGARQQADGFGGGRKLSDALRSGVQPDGTGGPFVAGILLNALEAVGNSGSRSKPLRGLIADNSDEYTALLPPAIDLDEEERGEQDHDGQPEVEDFPAASTQQAQRYGANTNNPNMLARMGLGPRFTSPTGFGVVGSGGGATASFGVQRSASFGSNYFGGINGGLGFTGGFTAQASTSLQARPGVGVGSRANATISFSANARANSLAQAQALQQQVLQQQFGGVYGNGVQVYGGIYQGTGIGGGIPSGVSGGIGPNGPGTLTMFAGGVGYKTPNGFTGALGYGQGLSANGPGLLVGGAPSAFATVAAPGSLQPNGNFGQNPLLLPGQLPGEQWPGQFAGAPPPLGTASGSFFVGPDGVSSNTNTTGIFI